MISPSDLDALRESFATWGEPGLPGSLATDCARLLDVTDTSISVSVAADQLALCTSSDDAQDLEDWEFTLHEGPCLDAAATSTTMMGDTEPTETNPWPRLSAKAHAIGYRSLAGVPLQAGGTTFGCLNLQDRHGTISAETMADAEHIAKELALLVVGSLRRRLPDQDRPPEHHAFHQATGMVMAQMRIDAGSAAEVLRAHAWANDRLLMDVASDVVSRTLTFPPTPPE